VSGSGPTPYVVYSDAACGLKQGLSALGRHDSGLRAKLIHQPQDQANDSGREIVTIRALSYCAATVRELFVEERGDNDL